MAGGKLIQLRLKNIDEAIYTETAKLAKLICEAYEAKLIINDVIKVALESGADGIHLGQGDTLPSEARKILGTKAIIGGTANTMADCMHMLTEGVDYLGVGPFRFTRTKEKLSPILGVEGYKKLIAELRIESKTPVFAIGGIEVEDFKSLYTTGIYGVAVSGILSNKSIVELSNIIEKHNAITN